MKVVLLGNTALNYSWFIKTYRQGLKRNGCELHEIDYKTNSLAGIRDQLVSIKPKYVFTHLTFHNNINSIGSVLGMYREVTKKVGTKWVHTCNDARTEDRYMGDLSDVIHMGFVGTLDMLYNCMSAWNIPVYYAPYSCLCYDEPSGPAKDLMFKEPVFTGGYGSHKDRKNFIDLLMKRIPIRMFATQSVNDLRHRTPELSMSAKCILGLCTGYNINGYIDVRPFQYMGTGAVMITRKFMGMDAMIPEECEKRHEKLYYPITSYGTKGADQLIDHWNRIQKEDQTELRIAAFDFMQRNHSCEVRLQYILEKLKHHG